MHKLLACAVIVLLGIGFPAGSSASPWTQAASTQAWTELRSLEGAFRVLFPGSPPYEAQEVPTKIGPIRMHRWALEAGTSAYQVIYADYPAAYVQGTTADAMLEGALTQMREGVKPGSVFESLITITLAGHPGREHVQDVDGYMMKGRVLLVGTRLYQVLAGVPSDRRAAAAADVERFLGSFALIVAR